MKVQRIERGSVVGLHHFFEAEVMTKFCVIDKVLTASLHLQKNVNHFSSPTLFTTNAHRGEVALQRWQKKTGAGLNVCRTFLFFCCGGMCACRDERNGALADSLYQFTPIFDRSCERVGVLSDERILNIRLLCNPAAKKL